MTATVLETVPERVPETELCYAGGLGLLGLFIGFLLTIGAFVVMWSLHFVHVLDPIR